MTQQSADRIPGSFPATRISAIIAASSSVGEERTRGWSTLAAAYWMPAYKYIRIRYGKSPEEAADLVQGFFAEAIEKNFFSDFDPARARFRTYLRRCLDGYCANEEKAGKRLKRGGDRQITSLDLESAEIDLDVARHAANDIESFFDREFTRSLLALALDDLRRELREAGKGLHLELFERYTIDDDDERVIGYKELAAEYDLPVTTITNHLAAARRAFRRLLLDRLRDLTASDEEFRSEARSLLGMDPA